jgi:two-component system chemotaxis response regulator CheB
VPVIRVVVAEDSDTQRELLVGILASDPEIEVVAQAKDGAEAVAAVLRLKPDVVTMDVHMPVRNGFQATQEIMVRSPTPIVIVSSTTSGDDVELSLNAVKAGALLILAKPDNPASAAFEQRRREFLSMVKAMSRVKVVRRWATTPSAAHPDPPRAEVAAGGAPRLVAVGASTGGPAALARILAELPADLPVPIVVVQHIASGFVDGLATWLGTAGPLRARVAAHGERLQAGTVHLAPDDRHLGVAADGTAIVVDAPPIDGFRPSATYLFDSAARAYGASLLAVILTGMGRDGVDGLKRVKALGGRVIAQDEGSSVVFGMPGEAVRAGVVDAVLNLEEIAQQLLRHSSRERTSRA